MLVALDVDGTIDAYPREMQSLMQALRAAGHTVVVVTGTNGQDQQPSQQELDEKAQFLDSLGCGQSYDTLAVIAHPDGNLADNKVAYLQSIGAHVLIDNNIDNIKAANKAGIVALLPWGSREK